MKPFLAGWLGIEEQAGSGFGLVGCGLWALSLMPVPNPGLAMESDPQWRVSALCRLGAVCDGPVCGCRWQGVSSSDTQWEALRTWLRKPAGFQSSLVPRVLQDSSLGGGRWLHKGCCGQQRAASACFPRIMHVCSGVTAALARSPRGSSPECEELQAFQSTCPRGAALCRPRSPESPGPLTQATVVIVEGGPLPWQVCSLLRGLLLALLT